MTVMLYRAVAWYSLASSWGWAHGGRRVGGGVMVTLGVTLIVYSTTAR